MLVCNFLRLVFTIIWCGSLYYDVEYQPRLGHEWYIYKLVMLTNLNFVILTIFSVLILVNALVVANNSFKSVLDFTFHCLIFPLAMVTCALFWFLHILDPSLVMPEWLASLIPPWLNHVTHTLPVIYVIFELLATDKAPPSRKTSVAASTAYVAIYFTIILAVRYIDGYWLYPLLDLLRLELLVLLFFASVAGYYFLIRLSAVLTSSSMGHLQFSSIVQNKYKEP
ncbi:hypothetical protein KIN20_024980 [Parelaphostrongylus tenuis]|uniref:FAR-17a/AIG1-like protein n=1 Tax=Parelaphostrongylus tenuis TaxID=148309 RepID=A0AAD5MXQ3_PARTN|nr:hypothetical protein KIN20_024980 [Parelaphostrongylus tenuis]